MRTDIRLEPETTYRVRFTGRDGTTFVDGDPYWLDGRYVSDAVDHDGQRVALFHQATSPTGNNNRMRAIPYAAIVDVEPVDLRPLSQRIEIGNYVQAVHPFMDYEGMVGVVTAVYGENLPVIYGVTTRRVGLPADQPAGNYRWTDVVRVEKCRACGEWFPFGTLNDDMQCRTCVPPRRFRGGPTCVCDACGEECRVVSAYGAGGVRWVGYRCEACGHAEQEPDA